MMRFLASMIVAFSLLAPASARSGKLLALGQAEGSSDEYAVYDAVIGNTFADIRIASNPAGKVRVNRLLIKDRTVSYPPEGLGPDQNLGDMIAPSLHSDLFADYRVKNQQPATLNRSFNINVDYVMFHVLDNALKSRPEPSRRREEDVFFIVSLSRVGFNDAHTEALVYMDYVCGGLCGKGFGVFVVKENGIWKVDKVSWLWIS